MPLTGSFVNYVVSAGGTFGEVQSTWRKQATGDMPLMGLPNVQSLPHYLLPVHPEEKRLFTILALP